MKRLVATVAVLATLFVARADERGANIVARMSGAVSAMKHYEVRFTVSADGMDSTSGVVVVSGKRYNIQLFGNEQFSDGRYKYDITPSQREVVIDKIDVASYNILNNPTMAFSFAASEFDARSLSATKVELLSKSRNNRVGKIILTVNTNTGLPTELVYDYDGEQIRIVINSFVAVAKVDEALFRYVQSKYRGWDIIDFR